MGRVLFNFFPHPAHMGHEGIFIAKGIVAPEGFAKRVNGDDFARVAIERPKQFVFFGGEGNAPPVFRDFAAFEIDLAVAEEDEGIFRFVAAA